MTIKNPLTLYHGSEFLIQTPEYGKGKAYNDYGRGFYCTSNIELAKEWVCTQEHSGYANHYNLDVSDLEILNLNSKQFSILSWLAILLKNRIFDTRNDIAATAKDYILQNFLPDTRKADVIIGYRADDSYFSFAQDFLNNTISVKKLKAAMRLGKLGEQLVLVSKKAFAKISFIDFEKADNKIYWPKRKDRDQSARNEYFDTRKNSFIGNDDLFAIDLIRQGVKSDDSRLQ